MGMTTIRMRLMLTIMPIMTMQKLAKRKSQPKQPLQKKTSRLASGR